MLILPSNFSTLHGQLGMTREKVDDDGDDDDDDDDVVDVKEETEK